ncbi:hypothetical protein CBW65_18055 [Tumebacillus avium]|uniref:Uncharacterized protein n=1 Tax=Tumebacillus avium TaxID=1903704 RepID=A0A1Y0IT64_9BACL|nr:hypothetical protein [Tumebacillus avium]ARU62665.1 hypothetical protein CBW65_18055 [Tumebacillus avium]
MRFKFHLLSGHTVRFPKKEFYLEAESLEDAAKKLAHVNGEKFLGSGWVNKGYIASYVFKDIVEPVDYQILEVRE